MRSQTQPEVQASAELPKDTEAAGFTMKRPGLFVVALIATAGAIYFAFLTPTIVSLAVRIFGVDPSGKALGLSTVILIGALIAVVMLPLFGSLSDRTRGRFGRRRPWLVGGGVVVLIGSILAGTATSVTMVAIGWAVSQLGFSAVIAAFLALIPDFVPDRLRARASAGIGIITGLVVLAGIAFANASVQNPFLLMVVPAVAAVVFVSFLAIVISKVDISPTTDLPRYSFREFAGSFFINPRRNPSFAWNWVSRLLFGIAYAGFQLYSVYFLTDVTGLSLEQATGRYAEITLITTPIGLVFTLAAGILSDKLGRRKIFVLGASVVVAAGITVAALTQNSEGFLVAYIIFQIGLAFYLTVDVAIAASVVPDPTRSAKAMGVYQVSTTAPNIVVPIIGALVFSAAAAAYVPLFLILAVTALLAAVAILFVKVR